MDKKDLKKILKPLMKECIKELLVEEGLLKVLSESIESAPVMVEQRLMQPKQNNSDVDTKRLFEEKRKRMLDEIGKSAYLNGINPFEGTTPLEESQAPQIHAGIVSERQKIPPAMKDIDPSDPGVNISGIMNLAAGKWKMHLGGKGK